MRVSIFGLGYVGVVSSSCLADLGHTVVGVDVAQAKVDIINQGCSPIYEADIDELIGKYKACGKLSATLDVGLAIKESDAAMICVGTPSTPTGGINTEYVETVTREIAEALRECKKEFFLFVVRSTSLPNVHQRLQEILVEHSGLRIGKEIGYVCHPEFLREGVAVYDFYNPPKIVFGVSDDKSAEVCRLFYPGIDAPTFFVTPEQASIVKYADNCFHATKVTFANEIGILCSQLGVDSHAVMTIFCEDKKLNISSRYLKPGGPFGGSCLPKDLRAVLDVARQAGIMLPMLSGASKSNQVQISNLVNKITSNGRSKRIGIVGLAFKEGTDDVRESPLVYVVEQLTGKGYPVNIFDPHLSVQKLIGENQSFAIQNIPHLKEFLIADLQMLIDGAQIVVISHRLAPKTWENISWKDQHIIDLVNIPEVRTQQNVNYEGLYW